jgi:hypothetical protein
MLDIRFFPTWGEPEVMGHHDSVALTLNRRAGTLRTHRPFAKHAGKGRMQIAAWCARVVRVLLQENTREA